MQVHLLTSLSQPDQSSSRALLESMQKELQGFVDRGPERRERVKVWYRRFCYENEIPLRIPYNPDSELPAAIAFEQQASSPEVADEVSRSQGIALRLIASLV